MIKFMFSSSLKLSIILAFCLYTGIAFAQIASPKATMVETAMEIEANIPSLLPAVHTVRQAASRTRISEYFNTCLAISKKVIRAGENMSDNQFKQFEMEYLAASQALPNTNCDRLSGLEKSICECKAEGGGGGTLVKCVSDKAPPEGY
ncbi:MAG: hypothetical protein ACKVU2_17055 [Saprospiraceae bacterium]